MDNEVYIDEQVPSGVLTGIRFKVLSEEDAEKASVKEISVANEVTDPALGFPNPASQCHTCGAKDYRTCEGHIGLIKFPFTILHPYFLPEVAQILNKICPGCKNLKKDKAKNSVSLIQCKYCDRSLKDVYPPIKFKVSTKDVFGKTAIIAESSRKVISGKSLPLDYWDFVPSDPQQEVSLSTSNRRVLTHAQVYEILKDVNPSFLKGTLGKKNKIFLQSFPLTPNCHRVAEFGQNLTFDERTRAYRKMIGFRGTANELSACVIECIKLSKMRLSVPLYSILSHPKSWNKVGQKLSSDCKRRKCPRPHGIRSLKKLQIRAEKPSFQINTNANNDDNPSKMHGLKYIKEVSLGKRTDFCFRMVCVGDPYIKLDEIGVPNDIAQTMLVSEQLNSLNWEKINASCGLRILQRGETFIRRRGGLVPVRYGDQLKIGDTVYRHLHDGDIVLINRPPSIHSHSLIALRVKVLPVDCVLSINPLICNPLRGDFDGDSLHGYIPQSLESRVELNELVSLENQMVDKQSGKNLLSLSHDSLTAAYLMLEDGVFFNRAQLQQLQMFCENQKIKLPDIMKKLKNSPFDDKSKSCLWTGRQLFSLVLGKDFDVNVNGTEIKKGEFVSFSNPSSCLQEGDDNLYGYMIKNYKGKEVLEFLHSFQELLIEWLSMRGFSVSLLDLYLSSDSQTNMKDEVFYGLLEAERQAHGQLLMVEAHQDFLTGNLPENLTENESYKELDSKKLCYDQQTSAALSRASASAFKEVFRDIQNLIYNYAPKENSFLSMLKAGSKGNMLKFVQHSMCVGYQHSLVPLSFHFPRDFSCVSWNEHKRAVSSFPLGVDSYVPYGVIKSSFLSGLNPLELFVHSVTNRDASFGGHADISGTLFRKLMFFMRDIYIGYDGTVRNCYGNQLVQFSYGQSESLLENQECGAPVGSLAACAISEAAYGALDQPISALENSPLLNLKKVLECGVRKLSGNKTASLFLSQKLKRWTNGFEYGALDVKNHLEKLLFQDVVSLVSVFYTPQFGKRAHFSPWVCYFRISKEAASRKQLRVQSIINALKIKCNDSTKLKKLKLSLPKLQMASNNYPEDDEMNENDDNIFITAQIIDNSSNSLDLLQDVVVPFLLETVIKGSSNVKKVDIAWLNTSKSRRDSSGELYLRVFMSENCDRRNFWRFLVDDCVQIMEMIDWERSHPDSIEDVILAQGIDAARNHFLSTLKSAIADTGKSILPEHLALAADCLSATGEFVPINAKGLSIQRKQTSSSSPFTQACFSNPSDCFVKAAKSGASDKLEGTIDALSWGKVPALGTGSRFDILFSGKEHQIDKPVDVYSLLSKTIDVNEEKDEVAVEVNDKQMGNKKPGSLFQYPKFEGSTDIMKMVLRKHISAEDIKRLSKDLKHILYKYDVNHKLSQDDKLVAWKALLLHPRSDEKIGAGPYEIKVGHNSKYGNTRCFILERVDGTAEDFSYHKCIHHALRLIAPDEAKLYESRWLNGK